MTSAEQFSEYVYQFNAGWHFQNFVDNFDENIKSNERIESTEVVKMLDEMLVRKSVFFQKLSCDKEFFRVRSINPETDFITAKTGITAELSRDGVFLCAGFDAWESKEPPLGIPGEGRNSIKGMSYLYLSENQFTACAEIRPHTGDLLSIARFVPERELTVIDFCDDKNVSEFNDLKQKYGFSPARMMTDIMAKFMEPAKGDRPYRVTQFISDYIRKSGVDGIRYRSSLTGCANVTLFHSHKSIIRFCDSRILYTWIPTDKILDLYSGEFLPQSSDLMQWTEESTNKVRLDVIKAIKQANQVNNYAD